VRLEEEKAMSGQITLLGQALVDLRKKVVQRLSQDLDNLRIEHNELNGIHSNSPYLTDFEEFYRRKMALGKLTQEEVDAKIDKAVVERGISPAEAAHMKKHLRVRPPTEREIQAAIEEEMRREALREEQQMEKTLRELREAQFASERETRRQLRQQRLTAEAMDLMSNRKITRRGRTLVFARNGQLYVFRKGRKGRLKMTSYYRALEGRLVSMGGMERRRRPRRKKTERHG
jgi:hypothetical protein